MNNAEFITLDNGLTVFICSDKSKVTNLAQIVTFFGGNSSFFDVTEREKKIIPGTAHLLEHYIFERNNNGNLMNNLNKYKAFSINASTNSERTSFYFNTIYNFEECIRILLTSIYDVSFDDDKLDMVKPAIYSEIRDKKDNIDNMYQLVKDNALFNTETSTIGDYDDVDKITSSYLEDVYRNFYVPNNQLLLITGNFDKDKIINLVKDIYSSLTFGNNRKVKSFIEDKKVVKDRFTFTYPNKSINEIVVSYKIDISDMDSFDKYKLDCYLSIFADINFSRFSNINEIVQNDSSFYGDIGYGSFVYDSSYHIINIYLYTDDFDKAEKLIFDTVSNFRDNSENDFLLIKKDFMKTIAIRKDNVNAFAFPTLDNYIYYNYPYEDTVEFINSLNYDEYISMIEKVDFSNYVVGYVNGDK